MLSYRIMSNKHPELEERIKELECSLSPIFPELWDVTLRIGMKSMRRAIAEYDYRTRRISIDPGPFEPDRDNILPSVLAHETMHAVQHIVRTVPYGERSCDIFMLARLPTNLYPKNREFYLKIPKRLISSPERILQTAKKALALRESGMRNYVVWFEGELKKFAN